MTQTVKMVFAKLNEVDEQLAQLNARKRELTGQLQGMVPEGSVVEGVRHVVINRSTTSYAQAIKAAHQALSAKAKLVLDSAVESCTKTTTVHQFREAAE